MRWRLTSFSLLWTAFACVGGLAAAAEREVGTAPLGGDVEDWPRWRGPRGDGSFRGPPFAERWPADGLKPEWSRPIGGGYAGVVVAQGRVYTMDRQRKPRDRERVLCFDAQDGALLWSHEYPIAYGKLEYDSGPRAAPTVQAGRVFALGAVGQLCCLDAQHGTVLWSRHLLRDLRGRLPTWGYAASPLCVGELVLVQPGGPDGRSVVALDAATGKPAWSSLSDQAAYATPILIEHRGQRQVICWTPSHIRALAPATGELRWSIPYQVTMGVSIAAPIFHRGMVLVSGYWEGSKAIRPGVSDQPAELVWEENRHLRGLMSQPLCRDGHSYLLDKQHGLTCFELMTGHKIWDDGNRATPRGRNPQATLVWVNDTNRALILNSDGELILAELDPGGYRELTRAKIIAQTWAHPAYVGQSVYARSDQELVHVRIPTAARRSR